MGTLKIYSPATGEYLGEAIIQTDAEVKMAVYQARLAQPSWKEAGFEGRSRIILEVRDLILSRMDELAELISSENGKPIIEAISHDIMPVMELMTYFAKHSEKLLRGEKIRLGKWFFLGHESFIEYEPYGVVGIISPWNFPFSTPMGGIVMALMAGNTVVLKPSEITPLIGLKIGELFAEAGLPKNVLHVITGDGATGASLVNSGVNKIIFTGSVPTGKKIAEEAAKTLIPVTLELGGKDPFIVLPDADLEMASTACVWGAFCNSGQVCASVERVYVPKSLEEPFTQLVVEKTKKLRQGKGAHVDVGCMTSAMQLKKVEAHVEEARSRGAKILTGGERNQELKGLFYKPTVITGLNHDFSVVKEETFGPVLPIMTYETLGEVIRLANDSPYALNAYIWAGDLAIGREVASKIIAGTVNVNESVFTYALPQTPWGGPKDSGIGRTHGVHGLLDLALIRHVHVNYRSSKKNNFWWYGYSPEKQEMLKNLCLGLFGKGLKRIKAFVKFLKQWIPLDNE